MKKQIAMVALLISIYLFCGCAHTPGDAAISAGHSKQAALLYKQGADQGDSSAALKLGLLIAEGRVNNQEFGSAAKWYERACELGNLPGCHNLGFSYEYGGNGVSKDIKKAYDSYLKAAEHGYMQSQCNLASLYSNQYIEPQNNVEGYKWMLLARDAAQKCKEIPLCEWILNDPPGHMTKLKNSLNEEQIKQAELKAKLWKPKM